MSKSVEDIVQKVTEYVEPHTDRIFAEQVAKIVREELEPFVRTAEELAVEIDGIAAPATLNVCEPLEVFLAVREEAAALVRSRVLVPAPLAVTDCPFLLPVSCELGTDESGVDYTPGEDINIIRDADDKQICHVFDVENSSEVAQYIVAAINGQRDPWTYLPELPPMMSDKESPYCLPNSSQFMLITVLRDEELVTYEYTACWHFTYQRWMDGAGCEVEQAVIAWQPRPAPATGNRKDVTG